MFIRLAAKDGGVGLTGTKSATLGSRSAAGPSGSWSWDGTLLTADVDRYGFQRMFYATSADGIVVSDSIGEVLAAGVDPALNDAAIAVFLRLGHFIANDTPYTAVRAFPIGGRLTWSLQHGVHVTESKPRVAIDLSISAQDALQRYVEVFRGAIGRGVPRDWDKVALPLSGGRDSRHIAVELHRLGLRPDLVISQKPFAIGSVDDAASASELAAALGFSIKVMEPAACPLEAEVHKNNVFEFTTMEHAWLTPLADHVTQWGARYAYDGIAGDVLSNGLFCRPSWDEDLQAGNLRSLFKRMSTSFSDETLGPALSREHRARWSDEVAFTHWRAEFERHMTEEDPVSRFMLWNRTRRCVAPFLQVHLKGTEILTPYLDNQVFDFLTSLPRSMFSSRDFHDRAIALAAPQFAHVPYAKPLVADRLSYGQAMIGRMTKAPAYWKPGPFRKRWLWGRLGASLLSSTAARHVGWSAPLAVWAGGVEAFGGSSVRRD